MFNRNEIGGDTVPSRQHHPWHRLEENFPNGGMWQIPRAQDRQMFVIASRELMANPPKFLAAMRLALKKWPRSCEAAMSTPSLNRRAWIGHAGCFLATGSPEETTRLGWHELDDGEQYAANAAADEAIREWLEAHRPHIGQDALFDEVTDA
jgi:hypothetical protein